MTGGAIVLSGARVYRSVGAGNQVIPAATFTPVVFDTVDFDTHVYFNIANPSRLTVPATGLYLVCGGFSTDQTTEVYLLVNGVTGVRKAVNQPLVVGGGLGIAQVLGLFSLAVGDFIEASVFGACNVTPGNELVNFQIARLG